VQALTRHAQAGAGHAGINRTCKQGQGPRQQRQDSRTQSALSGDLDLLVPVVFQDKKQGETRATRGTARARRGHAVEAFGLCRFCCCCPANAGVGCRSAASVDRVVSNFADHKRHAQVSACTALKGHISGPVKPRTADPLQALAFRALPGAGRQSHRTLHTCIARICHSTLTFVCLFVCKAATPLTLSRS